MMIVLKHTKCEVQGDKAFLLVNMEDFKAMLDTVSPKVLSEYLATRLKPKVEIVEPHKPQGLLKQLGDEQRTGK